MKLKNALAIASALCVMGTATTSAQIYLSYDLIDRPLPSENLVPLLDTVFDTGIVIPDNLRPILKPTEDVLGYLLDELDIDGLVVSRDHTSPTGRRFLRYEQQVDGRRLYGSLVMVVQNSDDIITSIRTRTVPVSGKTVYQAALSPTQALSAALNDLGLRVQTPNAVSATRLVTTFGKGQAFYDQPTVTEIVLATESGDLEIGYAVQT